MRDTRGEDFRALAGLLREQIEEPVRACRVLRMESRGRIAPSVSWENLKLAFDHFEDFERSALVGDAFWQAAFARVFGPMMPVEVRHFPSDRLDDTCRRVDCTAS